MISKLNKRTVFTALLAVLFSVCVVLGVLFLLPKSTAVYAEDNPNGHTHTNNNDGWTELTSSNYASLSDGNSYYLSSDLTITDSITISGTVTLCLNGHVLTYSDNENNGSVIIVSSKATFTLCDCNSSGSTHDYYVNDDGLYVICESTCDGTSHSSYQHAQTPITGGVITGGTGNPNSAKTSFQGAGVYVKTDATFNMYGGTIAGNSGNSHGGAVYINGSSSSSSTFNMYGGAISGNMTTGGRGGGVHVYYGSTFNMYGGTIASNSATNGGGVYVNGYSTDVYGTFNMYGGTITDNTASSDGGGVYISDYGKFEMSEGNESATDESTVISDNTAKNGGGVYLAYIASFTMTGGTISSNTANSDGGGVFIATDANSSGNGGTFKMTGGTISSNTASNGGGVYVDDGATFTMSSEEGSSETPTITGNSATNGGGVYVDEGTATISSGTISNNSGKYGDSVYVVNSTSKVEIKGDAVISGSDSSGYSIYVLSGEVEISDGTVDSIVTVNGTTTISGGTVTGSISGASDNVTVTGGTFSDVSQISEYLDSNSVLTTVVYVDSDGNESVVATSNFTEGAGDLQNAINNAEDGYTVKLIGDITESITIGSAAQAAVLSNASTSITLDLNGYTLTGEDDHTITNYGTLTIIDSAGSGTVTNSLSSKAALYNTEEATAYLKGGTYTRGTDNNYYVINNRGKMYIYDGVTMLQPSVSSSGIESGWYTVPDGHSTYAYLTIYGGTFASNFITIKNDEYSVLKIYDGTFDNVAKYSADQSLQNWAEATLEGGEYHAMVVSWSETNDGETTIKSSLKITGGTYYYVAKYDYDNDSGTSQYINDDSGADLVISGGEFTNAPAASYFADGYVYVKDTVNNMYKTVTEAVGTAIVNAQADIREYMAAYGWSYADIVEEESELAEAVIAAYNTITTAESEYEVATARLAAIEAMDKFVATNGDKLDKVQDAIEEAITEAQEDIEAVIAELSKSLLGYDEEGGHVNGKIEELQSALETALTNATAEIAADIATAQEALDDLIDRIGELTEEDDIASAIESILSDLAEIEVTVDGIEEAVAASAETETSVQTSVGDMQTSLACIAVALCIIALLLIVLVAVVIVKRRPKASK